MKKFKCPKCGEVIREEDLVALEVCDGAGDSVLLSAAPPAHLSVETTIEGIATVTTVRFKRVNPLALFLIPFTCIWSGGSLSGIYGSQIAKGAFDLRLSLFGLPFLFGSLALLGVCMFLLFGKHVLRLSAGKGSYFVGIGPLGTTRRFSYGRYTKIEEDVVVVNRRRGGSQTTRFLKITNQGETKDVHIGAGFSDDALAYTAALFRRECLRG